MATLLMMLSLNVFGLSTASHLARRVEDPAAVAREDLAAHLPPGAQVHLRLGGGLLPKDLVTPLDAIVAEPEVTSFLAPIRRAWTDELRALNAALHSTMGTDLQELLPFLRNGVEAAFYGFAPDDAQGRPVPDVVFLARRGEGERGFAAVIAPIRESLERRELASFEEVEGDANRLLVRANSAFAEIVHVAILDDLLVLATRRARLDEFLARRADPTRRDGLAADPDHAAFTRKCLRPGVVMSLWVRPEALAVTLAPMLPPFITRTAEAAGLNSLRTVGYAAELCPEGVRERLHVTAPKAKGLMAALLRPRAKLGAAEVASGEAGFFCSGAVDTAALVEGVGGVLSALMGSEAPTGATWTRIEERLGFPVREEIVARLGNEVGLTITFPGRTLIPHPTLIFSPPDPEALRDAIQRMSRKLGANVRLRVIDHDGVKVHVMDPITVMEGLPVRLRPSFAIIDGRFVLTPWPQATRHIVTERQAKRPTLAMREDFKRGLAACGGSERANWIHYVDFERAVGFLWDNGSSGLSGGPLEEYVPGLDTTLLPLSETLTKHLGPGVLTMRPIARGHFLETRAPISMLGFFVNLSLVGGLVLPRTTVPQPVQLDPLDAPATRAREQLRHLRTAVQLFSLKEGRLPTRAEWPAVLTKGSARQKAPYVSRRFFPDLEIRDPWGHPFEYVPEGPQSFRIVSRGADGKPGGRGSDMDLILRQ